MRRELLVLAIGATACGIGGRDSPYSYCRGDYARLEPDDVTAFGYSAQDAIDAVGLTHRGVLSWEVVDEPDYEVPLPPDSDLAVDLAVSSVWWGQYRVDTGGAMIYVECPDEGLEVDVEGVASLPGLGLEVPVEGLLRASVRGDDSPPATEDLGISVRYLLTDDQVQPFMPTLDAFAEAENIDYERIEATLWLSLSPSEPSASLTVTWFAEDYVMDAAMPFEPTLTLE